LRTWRIIRNGRRPARHGVYVRGILFALKAGLSLGGALSAWVLDLMVTFRMWQTEHALLGIRLAPASIRRWQWGSASLSDHLSDRQEAQSAHQDELAQRRQQFATNIPGEEH
jgi:hypothetical protein